mmetsp:Transcript_48149/g.153658  ORF Transcript_48149/g.153658 Transcript_48149/m.153658 type:complete len:635 (+) Transcript_48149:61-1965(+)
MKLATCARGLNTSYVLRTCNRTARRALGLHLRLKVPGDVRECILERLQLLVGVWVVLVQGVEQVEAVLAGVLHELQQGLEALGVDGRGAEVQPRQHAPGEVRHKLRPRGTLVVELARHVDHPAALLAPPLQEVLAPRRVPQPHALEDEGQAAPAVLAALGPEHGVRAEDVAGLGQQREHRRLGVHLHGEHVDDEQAAGRRPRSLQALHQLPHHALEAEDADRDDEDVQVLLDERLQRGAPADAHAGRGLRAVRARRREDVVVEEELPGYELPEVAEAHDAQPPPPPRPGCHGQRRPSPHAQVLQAHERAAPRVGAEDPEKGGDLLQVPDGVRRVGLVHGREEVHVEDVAVLRLAGAGLLRAPALGRRLGLARRAAGQLQPVLRAPRGPHAAHAPEEALQPVHDVRLARPALDLGQVDVAEREDREGLEEGAGVVLQREGYGGLALEAGGDGNGVGPEQEEAREVVGVVLDAAVQDLEAEVLRGELAADGRDALEAALADDLGAPGRVVGRLAAHAQPLDVGVALRQGLGVADDLGHLRLLRPGEGHEAMPHAEVVLGDDEEIVLQLQVEVGMDGSAKRVFDWHHQEVHLASRGGSEGSVEGCVADWLDVATAEEVEDGLLTVGAPLALEGDGEG